MRSTVLIYSCETRARHETPFPLLRRFDDFFSARTEPNRISHVPFRENSNRFRTSESRSRFGMRNCDGAFFDRREGGSRRKKNLFSSSKYKQTRNCNAGDAIGLMRNAIFMTGSWRFCNFPSPTTPSIVIAARKCKNKKSFRAVASDYAVCVVLNFDIHVYGRIMRTNLSIKNQCQIKFSSLLLAQPVNQFDGCFRSGPMSKRQKTAGPCYETRIKHLTSCLHWRQFDTELVRTLCTIPGSHRNDDDCIYIAFDYCNSVMKSSTRFFTDRKIEKRTWTAGVNSGEWNRATRARNNREGRLFLARGWRFQIVPGCLEFSRPSVPGLWFMNRTCDDYGKWDVPAQPPTSNRGCKSNRIQIADARSFRLFWITRAPPPAVRATPGFANRAHGRPRRACGKETKEREKETKEMTKRERKKKNCSDFQNKNRLVSRPWSLW